MKKSAFLLSWERWLLLGINLIIIALGIFFVFESSSVESFNVTQKIQQREMKQIQNDSSEAEIVVTQPHVWLLTQKQITGFGVGLIFFLIGSFIPSKFWERGAPLFYIAALILLVLVFIPPFANPQQGAHRWLKFFDFSFQPIEIVKVFLVVFFARLLSHKTDPVVLATYLAPPAILISLQPDFASLVLLIGTIGMIYFLAGASWKNIAIIGVTALVTLAVVMFSASYRLDRIETFLKTESEAENEVHVISAQDWHATQLKYAFGNGGWFGVGIGQSRQKFGYLPETSSDSIFAIVGEELGFVGASLVVILYVVYFYLANKIVSKNTESVMIKLFGYGLISLLILQTLLHFWTVSGLAPLTGITLPFFSYGSSSLATSMFITGVIFGLGKNMTAKDNDKMRRS